jgi:AcrR family transcriptional regulator
LLRRDSCRSNAASSIAGIGRLAQTLGVSAAAYWLFKSRDELLDELLKDWVNTNTQPFEEILMPSTKA